MILVSVCVWLSGVEAAASVVLFAVGLNKQAIICGCSSLFCAIIANNVYQKIRGKGE